MEYARELIKRHVSGRLKVAPEHTSDRVLRLMRKPSFQQFYEFKRIFDRICREEHLNQQIIPYFISSHPGCSEADMADLAVKTKHLDFQLEQVQDFTPTPMTVSTETWYTGYDPSSSSGINRKNVAALNRACVALAVQTSSANFVHSIAVAADLTPPFVQRPQHLFVQQIRIQQLATTLRLPNPCITLANNGKIIL